MLTEGRLEHILSQIPRLAVGVLGDLFLDKYLDLDGTLTEPSLETGLEAYQVVGVRCYAGAAGTVVNNLSALGVGRIVPISVIGDDGDGYELRRALQKVTNVDATRVFAPTDRRFRTPTYTKPLLYPKGQPPRELNRLDIKNRQPQDATDAAILPALDDVFSGLDALLVVDQVSEAECGIVTSAVRRRLVEWGQAHPHRWIIVDSRERISMFTYVTLKPNVRECCRAAGVGQETIAAAQELSRRAGRTVFCTQGERGIVIAEPSGRSLEVPAFPVSGPIDSVGAGDSSSAALACALAAGATAAEGASFANLAASITIQQIGITGTANPSQMRKRWRESLGPAPAAR